MLCPAAFHGQIVMLLQFEAHAGPRRLLLSTAGRPLVEAAPNDFVWGRGIDGSGTNHLGVLLSQLRSSLLEQQEAGLTHEQIAAVQL